MEKCGLWICSTWNASVAFFMVYFERVTIVVVTEQFSDKKTSLTSILLEVSHRTKRKSGVNIRKSCVNIRKKRIQQKKIKSNKLLQTSIHKLIHWNQGWSIWLTLIIECLIKACIHCIPYIAWFKPYWITYVTLCRINMPTTWHMSLVFSSVKLEP